jgi:hypothetical protein
MTDPGKVARDTATARPMIRATATVMEAIQTRRGHPSPSRGLSSRQITADPGDTLERGRESLV